VPLSRNGVASQSYGRGKGKVNTFVVKCLKGPPLATNPVPLAMKKQVLKFLEIVVGDV
jgi:hypothetical protein